MKDTIIDIKNRSVLFILLLNILTLGVYSAFWFHEIGKLINGTHRRTRFSYFLLTAFITVSLINASISILSLLDNIHTASNLQPPESIVSGFVKIFTFLQIFLSFKVKAFVEEFYYYDKKFDFKLSTAFTFLFGFLYLQHCFNKVVSFERDPEILTKCPQKNST